MATNGTENGHASKPANGLPSASNGMSSQNGHANGYANGISNGANGSKDNHTNSYANGLLDGASGIPVAICGMAMRLPGGICNDNDLYKFLFYKQDT